MAPAGQIGRKVWGDSWGKRSGSRLARSEAGQTTAVAVVDDSVPRADSATSLQAKAEAGKQRSTRATQKVLVAAMMNLRDVPEAKTDRSGSGPWLHRQRGSKS